MEMSQGNSLCSYHKQTKMSLFFFYKIGEEEGKRSPVWGVRGTNICGGKWGNGIGR
jgi:hypothetical protein